MTVTHCYPGGIPGAAEQIPVNEVGVDSLTSQPSTHAPVGGKTTRGVICFLHQSTFGIAKPPVIPVGGGFGIGTIATFAGQMNTDGWVFDYPNYPGDWTVGGEPYDLNYFNDCNTDSGHGARLTDTVGRWMDHYFIDQIVRFGTTLPTFLIGFSQGGGAVCHLIANGSPSGMEWPIIGFIAHCPVTFWQPVFIGNGFGSTTTTGMDLAISSLDVVSVPGLVGYSNTDGTVGWTTNHSQTSPMPYQTTTTTNCTAITSSPFITSTSTFSPFIGGTTCTVASGSAVLPANSIVTEVGTTIIGSAIKLDQNATTGGSCTLSFAGPDSYTYQMVANAPSNVQPYYIASSTVGTNTVVYPEGHLWQTLDGNHYLAWIQANIDPNYPISF